MCQDEIKGNAKVNDQKLRIGIYNFKIIESPASISPIIMWTPFSTPSGSDTVKMEMKLKVPSILQDNEITLYKIK